MNGQIAAIAGLTLMASFLCSLFEAALYAITPAKIGVLRRRGVRAAEHLHRLRRDVEEPIAAILTINTVAHTVGAAWCGALVGEAYGSRAVGVFATVFTILVLALTEIVPKSLGVRYAVQLGPLIAWPLQLMIWSTWPVVWLARRAMALLIGRDGPEAPSEEELVVVSRLAADHGAVRDEEHRWVKNALRLDTVKAGDLRTPRAVVESYPADTPVEELTADLGRWVHSRVLLTEAGHSDAVVGLVHRRQVLDAALRADRRGGVLRDHVRPVRFVPESMPAHRLLELFIREREHLVAVVDEYGGFEGVVTLEDVLEYMLGAEIVDEHDQVDDLQALARERGAERLRNDERPVADETGDGETGDGETGVGESGDGETGVGGGDPPTA